MLSDLQTRLNSNTDVSVEIANGAPSVFVGDSCSSTSAAGNPRDPAGRGLPHYQRAHYVREELVEPERRGAGVGPRRRILHRRRQPGRIRP